MTIFGIMFVFATFMPHSFALPANSQFYVKGMAEEYGPFSGSYIRILVHDHNGTIIVTSDSRGVIRPNLSDSVTCYDVREKVCLTGLVVQTRNIAYPDVGDLVRLSVDPDGKKQTISFLKDKGVGSIQYISFGNKSAEINQVFTAQRFLSLPEEKGQSVLVNHHEDSKMSDAIAKARQFTVTHPTFVFDGVRESLKLNLVGIITGEMPLYQVQVNFDSTHNGYGDRTGQGVIERTTPHTMIVMVSDLGVGSAIMDGVWDEFNQSWQK